MTEFSEVMKSAMFEYITNNSGKVDYVDINHYSKIHAAFDAVAALEDEGKVRRVWTNVYHRMRNAKENLFSYVMGVRNDSNVLPQYQDITTQNRCY